MRAWNLLRLSIAEILKPSPSGLSQTWDNGSQNGTKSNSDLQDREFNFYLPCGIVQNGTTTEKSYVHRTPAIRGIPREKWHFGTTQTMDIPTWHKYPLLMSTDTYCCHSDPLSKRVAFLILFFVTNCVCSCKIVPHLTGRHNPGS